MHAFADPSQLLLRATHLCVHCDDILIMGKRLESVGFRLKHQKCAFMQQHIEYLGHYISAERLKPSMEKVRAMAEVPATDVSHLKSFGLLS